MSKSTTRRSSKQPSVSHDFHSGFDCFDTSTIGERGQVVIPVKVRNRLSLKAGDSLVVFVQPGGFIGMAKSSALEKFMSEFVGHFGKILNHKKRPVS